MPPKRKAITQDDPTQDDVPIKSVKLDPSATISTATAAATTTTAVPLTTVSTLTTSLTTTFPNTGPVNKVIDVRNPNLESASPVFIIPNNGNGQTINWYYKETEFKRVSFELKYQQLIETSFHIYNSDTINDIRISNTFYIRFGDMTCHDGDNIRKPIIRNLNTAVWSWEKSRGVFSGFEPDISKSIEIAFLRGSTKGPIDSQRYINFSTYEQIRFDNATKTRRVQRTFIDTEIEIQNPTWYYVDKKSNNVESWEIFPDSIEIEKAFQNFLKNARDLSYQSSVTQEVINFCPLSTKSNKIIKRDSGSPDIVPLTKKSYSQLSEEEKKEIIKLALSGGTPQPPPQPQVNIVTKQTNSNNQLYLPGEEAIIDGNIAMKYILRPCRHFDSSAADLHFRTAESQFYRLLESSASSTYKVKKVEYIVNPKLIKAFYNKKSEYENLKYPDCSPVFGFHGTSAKNILGICKTNFKISMVGSTTDSGWYGKGIYFSEYPEYSIGYISDCSKILLCKVLLGKSYKCTGLITGEPLKTGYTSHLSPDEQELVIFSPDQILPCYIVHYDGGDQTYSTAIQTSYQTAIAKPSSHVFSGYTIHTIGTLIATAAQIKKFINSHGGTNSATNFTILVVSPQEFMKRSGKVSDSISTNIPVVTEEWLYKCVIDGKIKNTADFSHQFQQVKKSQEIKPVPLEFNDDGDDDSSTSKDDDEEKDEVKKPPCQFGKNCYRKNFQHFQQYSHEFLID